jgi:hypothetical protein
MVLQRLVENGFEIECECHAGAILEGDFPSALGELEQVLVNMRVPIQEIIGSGGGEAKGTQRMRKALNKLGWRKRRFEIKKSVDGVERESVSHEVDHVKGFGGKNLALEIQWNNKDPFFDRDLENLKRLHAEGGDRRRHHRHLGGLASSAHERLRPPVCTQGARRLISRP